MGVLFYIAHSCSSQRKRQMSARSPLSPFCLSEILLEVLGYLTIVMAKKINPRGKAPAPEKSSFLAAPP